MRVRHAIAFILVAAGRAQAQGPLIEHSAVQCVVAEKFPRLEAKLTPSDNIGAARVVFQPEKTDQWWSVAMKSEGASFAAALPKPKKSLTSFRYYVEATDKALATSRTQEFRTTVVGSAGECRGKLAGVLAAASVLVQGPAGAALPTGFASAGVIAGSASGAAAGGAAAGAAGGGGLGTGVLVAGGVVAAAGVAVAVAPKSDSSNSSGSGNSGGSNSGGTNSGGAVLYSVSFLPSPPGINVTPCGFGNGFSGGAVSADSNGNFDTIFNPSTPILRVAGRVTSTSFQATLSCTNGAQTGTINATGGPNTYNGTFVFGSSSGNATVTKQ